MRARRRRAEHYRACGAPPAPQAARSTRTLDGMRCRALLSLAAVTVSLIGCASISEAPDDMCAEIATFANASVDGTERSVRLATDWGGLYTAKEDQDEVVTAAQNCAHDGYEAGKALCAYLLRNTSMEFPGINHRRALACIGRRIPGLSPTDDKRLPPSASSNSVLGVKSGTTIRVELRPTTDVTPPILVIAVRASTT